MGIRGGGILGGGGRFERIPEGPREPREKGGMGRTGGSCMPPFLGLGGDPSDTSPDTSAGQGDPRRRHGVVPKGRPIRWVNQRRIVAIEGPSARPIYSQTRPFNAGAESIGSEDGYTGVR